MTNQSEQFSEINARLITNVYRARKHIIDMRKQRELINEKLKDSDISVKYRSDLESADDYLSQQIARIRFSGFLDEYFESAADRDLLN